MALPFQLGVSDFRNLRRGGYYYVDKTRFIPDLLQDPWSVILCPRPRRFGKTINMSTLRYFLEKSDEPRRDLFDDLEVSRNAWAWQHFQRYPVLWITFKDVKAETWEQSWTLIRREIEQMFREHAYLLDATTLSALERLEFTAILQGTAADSTYTNALKTLSGWLHRHHGAPVAILIDEYDTPIDHAFALGLKTRDPSRTFFDQVVSFFRNFFSGGLKDNSHLFKAVMTGILRVSKESLFSGLNNIGVYSLLADRHKTTFGFTEAEVQQLAEDVGRPDLMGKIRDTYNGYMVGLDNPVAIYNPWSTLSCLALVPPRFDVFWVNSASNELLRQLLLERGQGLNAEMETLLQGGQLERVIHENLSLRELDSTPDAVWSFLLFMGYLKPAKLVLARERYHATLEIPNREVMLVYEDLFSQWIRQRLTSDQTPRAFADALLSGDVETLEQLLGELLRVSGSPYDPIGRQPEKFYHGLVLGLLMTLEGRYRVRSNASSGYGRVDLLLQPREAGQPGALLELKVIQDGQTPLQALQEALTQIRDKAYLTELQASGATPVQALGVAFDGQKVWVKPYSALAEVQAAVVREAKEARRRAKALRTREAQAPAPAKPVSLLTPMERAMLGSTLAATLDADALELLCLHLGLDVLPDQQHKSLELRWSQALRASEAGGRELLAAFFQLLLRRVPAWKDDPTMAELIARVG